MLLPQWRVHQEVPAHLPVTQQKQLLNLLLISSVTSVSSVTAGGPRAGNEPEQATGRKLVRGEADVG